VPTRRSAALIPALMVAASLLAACAPSTPAPGPDTTLTPGPSVSPTTDPDPIETAVEVPDDIQANIVDAMNSGNTAALEGYLAARVHITYCASEDEGDSSDPVLIIGNVTRFATPISTWDFDLPSATVDNYANNPGHYPSYADDFPAGRPKARSSRSSSPTRRSPASSSASTSTR
jgi:hypothetical protein